MCQEVNAKLPTQNKLIPTVDSVPVEYFPWGKYPDHFKIDMPHRHVFSELLFFEKGGGVHEIDYKDFEIADCSIHYIPKSTIHFLKRDIHSAGFTIAFDDQHFESNPIHKFLQPLPTKPFALSLEKNQFQELLMQSQMLLKQMKKEDEFYRKKCFLLTMELLLQSIASAKSKTALATEIKPLSKTCRQFQYLATTNIHVQHKVSWYAKQLYLAPKSLGNKIKLELERSPKQYLQEVLLASVKSQLIDSDKSIKQIALDHNCDASSLGKLFKRQVGYSMNAYRSA